jgi:hypothetical protein
MPEEAPVIRTVGFLAMIFVLFQRTLLRGIDSDEAAEGF